MTDRIHALEAQIHVSNNVHTFITTTVSNTAAQPKTKGTVAPNPNASLPSRDPRKAGDAATLPLPVGTIKEEIVYNRACKPSCLWAVPVVYIVLN